jgi:hypothetical protein
MREAQVASDKQEEILTQKHMTECQSSLILT